MKLVILAGGKGTRLGLTDIPKPMVEVGGKSLLLHQIELAKRYGIKDVFILSGHLANRIFDYFKDGAEFGVKISHVIEPYPLGTAGSLKLLEHFIKENDFLVFYGDLMLDIDINRLLTYHKKKKAIATLVVHPNDHPYDSDLLELDKDGCITAFHPKPHKAHVFYKNIVNAAVYVCSRRIFNYIPFGVKTDFGSDIFPDLLKKGEKLAGYKTTEYIKDIGTRERLDEVNLDFDKDRIVFFNFKNKKNAIFLDRDGVINEEVNLLHKIEDFRLLPNVSKAIKRINKSNYLSVVITNQPVVARNLCTLNELEAIHKKMEALLGKDGAYLDGIYFCPHHPDKGFPDENPEFKIDCDCRKPKPGLIKQAVKDLNINLKGSYIIGDSERDIKCGKAIGLTTIGVRTGNGCKTLKVKPDFVFDELLDAVNFIINEPYKAYCKLLIERVKNIKKKPFIITIGGNTRSGKTTLSKYLEKKLNEEGFKTKVVHLDNWLLPIEKRTEEINVFQRYQLDKLNIDCKNILDGRTVYISKYSQLLRGYSKGKIKYFIGNANILIFEGVVALSVESLLKYSHYRIFCDIKEALLYQRITKFYKWKGLLDDEIVKIFQKRKVDEYEVINSYKKYADLIIEDKDNDNC